eukprot:CAMPEP_0181175862 /NCGR_PEP_ID=MMETSP1096-20121128/4310_1 /TAXON_ID=156174 ORGANISM="Chrysochromulina ericina, Strain CCMP281" /NCGR_SAMPLE_ID=MMETSP1096 /ASSEMBLY_ACC=CAM_ASM_000453 /LENGTH=167 /DNA_ID=CAMNT_0023263887 /DNA_START=450 /DNA_END=955 /DNA_ORIENTATION=+
MWSPHHGDVERAEELRHLRLTCSDLRGAQDEPHVGFRNAKAASPWLFGQLPTERHHVGDFLAFVAPETEGPAELAPCAFLILSTAEQCDRPTLRTWKDTSDVVVEWSWSQRACRAAASTLLVFYLVVLVASASIKAIRRSPIPFMTQAFDPQLKIDFSGSLPVSHIF